MSSFWRLFFVSGSIAAALLSLMAADRSEAARDPDLKRVLASLGPDSPYQSSSTGDSNSHHTRPDVIYQGKTVFPVPLELRGRVDFWKDIYSVYTTSQAVIHDKDNLDIIYEVVDFDRIFNGRKVSDRSKRRYLKKRKAHVAGILRKLYRNKGKAVTAEEKAIAAKFDIIPGYRKFRDASHRVRAQRGLADRFKEGLKRSGKYLSHMREIFRSYGLPEELCALPHVESSFNYKAYSSAGAAGIWQFTRGTGRLFMKLGYTVDERRDPIVSTDAAARLLRQNYEKLGSWPLAITAYNHGANGMMRAKRKYGTDILKIIKNYRSRRFGFASRNFYVEFLAALEVARNYGKHFGHIEFEPRFVYDEIVMQDYVPAGTLARKLNVPAKVLQEYNPALRKSVWRGYRHIPKGLKLRVPGGMGNHAATVIAYLSERERFSSQKNNGFHRVIPGDTLSTIAMRYRTTVSEIKGANGLRSDMIFAGQRLRIPGGRNSSQGDNNGADHHYVRPGESLYLIARRYGTTVSELARINDISRRATIYPGQKLAIKASVDSGELPMVASLEPVTPAVHTVTTPAVATEPENAITDDAEENQENGSSVSVDGNDLRVKASDFEVKLVGEKLGVITVKAEESLGLYADWLRVSKRHIQRLNRRNLYRNIKIGYKVKLPLVRVSKEYFERKRLEYHMGLMEDFFEVYKIEGEKSVSIRRGQSLWELCVNRHDAPLWLVRLYNPDLNMDSLMPGDSITIPVVSKK